MAAFSGYVVQANGFHWPWAMTMDGRSFDVAGSPATVGRDPAEREAADRRVRRLPRARRGARPAPRRPAPPAARRPPATRRRARAGSTARSRARTT